MILPYMFVIKSVPTPKNQNYNTVGGAYVHIWVMDGEQDAALLRALTYVRKYLWEPQEVQHAFQPLPEQIAALGEDETRLYQTALQYGIAAEFVGWLKDEGDPDWPAILWRP